MHVQNKKYGKFVFISRLTAKCATYKFKNLHSSSLWKCLHHVVILRSQNKNTDFLMILAARFWYIIIQISRDLNPNDQYV